MQSRPQDVFNLLYRFPLELSTVPTTYYRLQEFDARADCFLLAWVHRIQYCGLQESLVQLDPGLFFFHILGGGGGAAHGIPGRHVADDWGNTRRGRAIGPHAQGNAGRHGVDNPDVDGVGSKNRKTTPTTTSTTPVRQVLGPANAEKTTPAAAAVRTH